MHDVAVLMDVRRAGRALAGGLIDGAPSEADEHERHAELERVRDARRHLRAQEDEHGADHEQRQRVAEPPARAEERRLVAAALARDERGDRGEVIRLERVAHAEQRSEPGAGDEFENWHDVAVGRYFT